MENNKFNIWGFIEGKAFKGLMPKVMEKLGADYTDGFSETNVSIFDPHANGVDSMEVVSEQKIALSDGSQPEPPVPPTPEHDFNRPDSTENTPEQDELADNLVEEMVEATKTVKIDFSEQGELNNITIPEEVNQFVYLTGSCVNGATITSKSTKGLSIVNTSEEPIDVIIDCVGPIYLGGKFNNVYSTQKSVGAASAVKPEFYGTITFDEAMVEDNQSVSGIFYDGSMVQTKTTGTLTVTNQNTELVSMEIYAPNGDIQLGGKYDELTVTVSEDTMFMKANSFVNKLILLQGNVKFYGIDVEDFVGEVVGEGRIEPMSWNIPDDGGINKMTSNGGIYNITEDIETTSVIGFGIFGTGKYQYNLNGHYIATTNKNYLMFLRGTVNVNVYGDGGMANIGDGYGCWVSSKDATLNIYGGEFKGNTHTLYAENGTINVYGGVFKLTNADTADRDINGNLKFLLNCFDSSYTSGNAKINVYGGKFYEFNPAVTYGEPGGPVSYVAEGYHVVESVEDGLKVYEVVKD